MKKLVVVAGLCLLLFSSCKKEIIEGEELTIEDNLDAVDQEEDDLVSEDEEVPIDAESEDEVVDIPVNIENYDVNQSTVIKELDAYGTLYSGPFNSLFLIKDETVIPIELESASEPQISLDGKKLAYIDAYDFELIGNLKVFDVETQESKVYTEFDYGQEDQTVKAVAWIDEEHLALIIGYAYGTASHGGDVYLYDMTDEKLSLWVEAEKNTQIVKVKPGDTGLELGILNWLDDNYMEYEIRSVFYAYDQLDPVK